MGTLVIWFVVFFGILAGIASLYGIVAALDTLFQKMNLGHFGSLVGIFVVVAATFATLIALSSV